MKQSNETASQLTIAVLGGTGHVGVQYITEFLAEGVHMRVLARTPEQVTRRFSQAEVMAGSMMDETEVARALENANAVFLITPIGGNNDAEIELRAARTAIAAARAVQLPHLIYVSQIQLDQPTGVPVLDVKAQIDGMLAASGVP